MKGHDLNYTIFVMFANYPYVLLYQVKLHFQLAIQQQLRLGRLYLKYLVNILDFRLITTIVLCCIVSIYLYSASRSAHQPETLPGRETQKEENTKQSWLTSSFIDSFIPAISIAPLQVLYYSEALPTTERILYRSFTPKRTGNCR